MAGTLAAIREAAGSSTIEELLWIAWERSGLATAWRDRALGSGVGAAEANRDLDGIVALFAAAVRFSERRPDLPAEEFLAELLDTDVADDLIAPTANVESVLVTTPAGLLGLEFDTVVVAGLQEGVWPNLRPRSTLLAAPELARAAAGAEGPVDARRAVLDDELRMFALAVSRARDRVVLAAVANDDETPSALLGLVPDAPLLPDAGSPLTLRGLTGRLRRSVTSRGTEPATRAAAASTLARLAELGIPGASPDDWHGLRPPSSTGPLFEGEPVPISPSKLQRFEESPLDWFLETIAGSSPTTLMSVGTLLHAAMERATDPTVEAVWAIVEERWPELVFESAWLGEHHRRAARVLATAIAEYLRDFRSSGATLVGAEPRFELVLDDVVVRGAMDRVERSADGGVVIVDLKTGNPIPKSEIAAHPQLAAYQLAYRSGALDEALEAHGEHRPGGAKLLFVKQGEAGRAYREAVQAALDDEALEAFRERIRAAATGMRATSFAGAVELRSYGLGNVAELRLHRAGAVSGD
jgi:RecB family exonuclease